MALWRSGYAEVCKTLYTGSIPVGASKFLLKLVSWNFSSFALSIIALHSEKIPIYSILFKNSDLAEAMPPNSSCGRVAELVYAFDLKSNDESHTGSSPVSATKIYRFCPPILPKWWMFIINSLKFQAGTFLVSRKRA